jgi:thiazole synthase
MAQAMREAVHAGRKAFLAGRMPKRRYANASSPKTGLLGEASAGAAGRNDIE